MKSSKIGLLIAVVSLTVACADQVKEGDAWKLNEELSESADGPGDVGKADGSPDEDTTPADAEPGVYAAAIYDRSEGDDACNGYDSGSDIFGVALENQTGEVLGWGHVVAEGIAFEGNNYPSTTPVDGSAPGPLDEADCPLDFNDDTVITLGCGGWAAVEFLNDAGNAIALEADSGQQIRVYEYGIQCSTGTDDDSYDLNVCLDTEAVRAGDDASCEVQLLMGARGEVAAEVAGF